MGGHSERRNFNDPPVVSCEILQTDPWNKAKKSAENCGFYMSSYELYINSHISDINIHTQAYTHLLA